MELPDSSYSFLERMLGCKSLLVCDDNLEESECQDFWTSEEVAAWFEAQGYTPYKRSPEAEWSGTPSLHTSPSLPYDNYQEADYPYAYHNAQGENVVQPYLTARNFSVGHFQLLSPTLSNPSYRAGLCMRKTVNSDTLPSKRCT